MTMPLTLETPFTRHAGINYPIICGPMYPCSNPELVAAVSAAGGIGIVQPVSLTYVFGYEFRAGLRYIKSLTDKPIGMNALIEQSSRRYRVRMEQWIDIALEEGVRFFITSLGKPDWVVRKVHALGGMVYHDCTEQKWAKKGIDSGVDGLIAVNNRAGGHAGAKDQVSLYQELAGFNIPVVCAGGIATAADLVQTLNQGYAGVQMGTRFIASRECRVSDAYKQAIVDAREADIVMSERLTGVPVAVIRTSYIQRLGIHAGPLARLLLRNPRTKHWMRLLYTLRSLYQLKNASQNLSGSQEYWQAGKSVAAITRVESVAAIIYSMVTQTKSALEN